VRAITLVFLCALAVPSLAANGPDRLRAFLEQVRTLRAEFQQSIYDEDARLLDEARGMVYIARPGRFRWDYAEPYLQEIVGDGEKVWIYDSELEQVTVRPLGDALGDTPVMLLSSDEPVENRFEVRAIDGPEGFEWVGLRPLGESTLPGSASLSTAIRSGSWSSPTPSGNSRACDSRTWQQTSNSHRACSGSRLPRVPMYSVIESYAPSGVCRRATIRWDRRPRRARR